MPVSGLVITLAPPPPDAPGLSDASRNDSERVIEKINQHPHLQTGPRRGHRLPIVVDTPDSETDKRCWRWLNELEGVHHVDVAFVHFEDEDAFEHAACSPSQTHNDRLIPAPTIGET